MDEPHQIECPQCGFKGKTRTAPADGVSVRCVKCGESFVFRLPTPPPSPAPVASVFKPIAEPSVPISPDWIEAKSLKAMDARLRKAERWNRGLAAALGLLGLLTAWSLYSTYQAKEMAKFSVAFANFADVTRANMPPPETFKAGKIYADEVITREVAVTDPKGNVLAKIASTPEGEPRGGIVLQEVGGESYAVLTSRGSVWYDAKNKARIILSTADPSQQGESVFMLADDKGVVRYDVRTTKDGVHSRFMGVAESVTSEFGNDGGAGFLRFRHKHDGNIYDLFGK